MRKKENSGNEIGVWIGSVVMGAIMIYWYGGGWMGQFLIGIGIIGGAIESVKKPNPYKRLFENCGLTPGGETPVFSGETETDYGYDLRFSLPPGLSTDDFEEKKLAIEQYLGKRICISYENKNVIIKVHDKDKWVED